MCKVCILLLFNPFFLFVQSAVDVVHVVKILAIKDDIIIVLKVLNCA